MPENWLRWHVGTTTDPKWRVIARRAGEPIHVVLSVWCAMLERATRARGSIDSWSDDGAASALDLSTRQVAAVRAAMHGKVLDGNLIMGWALIRMPGNLDRLPWHLWAPLRASVFDRDGHACRYCGASDQPLECDHVIPIASGGSDDESNLVTACRPCNRAKGAKSIDEWDMH